MRQKTVMKRCIAHLLSVLMILSTVGAGLSALGILQPQEVNAASITELSVGDHVKMGKAGAEGYTGLPEWRVIDKDGDGNYLFMSEYLWTGDGTDATARVKFDASNTSNAWQDSDAQKWCKGFETAVLAGTPGLKIKETTKSDPEYVATISTYSKYTYAAAENILNKDTVFFLSAEEASTYMPTEADRIAYLSDKATADLWYLRSPDKDNAKRVGEILKNGKLNRVTAWTACAARPVFWGTIAEDMCVTAEEDGNNAYNWTINGNHEYGQPEYTWTDDNSQCTAKAVCAVCGEELTETVDATSEVTKEATTEAEGETTYTAAFQNEAFAKQTKTEPIPKKEAPAEPEKQDGNKPADKGNAAAAIADGQTATVDGSTVKVISANEKTAEYVQAPDKKSVTVPATVAVSGQTLAVTQIGPNAFTGKKIKTVTVGANVSKIAANAFKGSKATKMIVKTKKLTKASVKGSLKGSKIKTVQVKVGKKKVNKKFVKKYKKIFTKKNAGKKVKVK